ncbi:uncharacterized protein LOC116923772 [Daphnia magna]|uniref:uncharacterized protein LOC116923772 n=1 Tax=Daphnia magna TaxID=35525 RepID=UPI001E1BD9CC|nr:uncharacterized protein LOC116923772 [Daphnia magna]
MNLYKPILSLIVFIALAYLAVADELTSNSLTEHISETSSLTDASNGGTNWGQGISSRNSGYLNNPRVYSHRPSPYQSYNKISSRDSTSYGGTPIHIANATLWDPVIHPLPIPKVILLLVIQLLLLILCPVMAMKT